MNIYVGLFAAGLIALLFSLLLTPICARLLTRFGIVDQPSERRINKKPIPRGGGLALVVSCALTFIIARVFFFSSIENYYLFNKISAITIAVFLLVAIGFADDILSLNPFVKLFGQIAVALILFATGISVDNLVVFALPAWLNLIVTVAWFVIIINAFNLIDGLDGLATGLAVIGAAGLAVTFFVRGNIIAMLPLIILIGAGIGFLRYNFNPATIFLGDSGSMFLGLVLAIVPLESGGKSAFLASVAVPLLVIGVPLFDTVLAVWRRTMKVSLSESRSMKQIFLPDMEHLHHRFLAAGLSQKRVAWILYILAAIMVIVAIGMTVLRERSLGVILIGIILVAAIMSRQLSRVELWYTGNVINRSFQPKLRRFLMPMHVIFDICVMFFAWFFAAQLTKIGDGGIKGIGIYGIFPVFFASIFGFFWVFRVYMRDWANAQVRDYVILAFSVIVGWVLGYAIITVGFNRYVGFWRHAVTFLMVCLPVMLAGRTIRAMLRSALNIGEENEVMNNEGALRMVVYGAGERFVSFDALKTTRYFGGQKYCIVGVIDDDETKHGQYIHGYKIQGGIEKLAEMITSVAANSIVVAADVADDRMASLIQIAEKDCIKIFKFNHMITELYVPVSKQ